MFSDDYCNENLVLIVNCFKALSCITRIKILVLIKSEALSIRSISTICNISYNVIKKHIKIMNECGLIITTKNGNLPYYQLNVCEWDKTMSNLINLNEKMIVKEKEDFNVESFFLFRRNSQLKPIKKEDLRNVKELDLLPYLMNYEPDELVKESRNVYSAKTHSSLKISIGMWTWWALVELRLEHGLCLKFWSRARMVDLEYIEIDGLL